MEHGRSSEQDQPVGQQGRPTISPSADGRRRPSASPPPDAWKLQEGPELGSASHASQSGRLNMRRRHTLAFSRVDGDELPKPVVFDEVVEKAARRQRAVSLKFQAEECTGAPDVATGAESRQTGRIQRSKTAVPFAQAAGNEESAFTVPEAQADDLEGPGTEWASRLMCLEAREARRETCRQVTSLITTLLPQMEKLSRPDLQKVTNILDEEIETKQRQLAQEAYAIVCKDFEDLKNVRHQLMEVENKMALMNNTYLKEITAHRDRERVSSDVAFQALAQNGDHQSGVTGGSVQFFEPLQHISDEMRSLFLTMLEEKLKAIFDFDPTLREKTNKAELARFDNSLLEARVASYQKINSQLRDEVRDLSAKLKKAEVGSQRSFWDLQHTQANLYKVKQTLEAKEAEVETAKDEYSQVKFLQEQAHERARKHVDELGRKEELVDVLRNQARQIRRKMTRVDFEEEDRSADADTQQRPLLVDCGVQTDPEPMRRFRLRQNGGNVAKEEEEEEEEVLKRVLDEKDDNTMRARFKEQYALARKELEVAMEVAEQKEDDLDTLIEQEKQRLSPQSAAKEEAVKERSLQVSFISGFRLAGSGAPVQEPEPEQQSELDGDQDGGQRERARTLSKNTLTLRAQGLLGGMGKEVEECAARVRKLEGADLLAVLTELKAAYDKAEEAEKGRDAAEQQYQLMAQMTLKPQSLQSLHSVSISTSRASSSTDDVREESKAVPAQDIQGLAMELQEAQEALMHAQLKLETLPVLHEELETTRERLEDTERQLALLNANVEDSSALKQELAQQSVAKANLESDLTTAKAALSMAISRNKSLEASLAMITEGTTGPSSEQNDLVDCDEVEGASRSLNKQGGDPHQTNGLANVGAQFRLREKLFVKRAQLQEIMQENSVLHLSLEEMQREVNELSKRLRKALPQSQVIITKDLETVMHKMEWVAANGGGAYMRMHKQARLREVATLAKVNLSIDGIGSEAVGPRRFQRRPSGAGELGPGRTSEPGGLDPVMRVTSLAGAKGRAPAPPCGAEGSPMFAAQSYASPPQQPPAMSTITIDPFSPTVGEAGRTAASSFSALAAQRSKMRRGTERGVVAPHTAREARWPSGRQIPDSLQSARALADHSPSEHKERVLSGEIPHVNRPTVTSFSSRTGVSRPQQLVISPQSHAGSTMDPASPLPDERTASVPTTLPALFGQPISPAVTATASLGGSGSRRCSRSKTLGAQPLAAALAVDEQPELVAMPVRMRPAAGRRLGGARPILPFMVNNDVDVP